MARAQTPPRVEVASAQASQIHRPNHLVRGLVRSSDGKVTGERAVKFEKVEFSPWSPRVPLRNKSGQLPKEPVWSQRAWCADRDCVEMHFQELPLQIYLHTWDMYRLSL